MPAHNAFSDHRPQSRLNAIESKGIWKCRSSPLWLTVLSVSVSSPEGKERETRAKPVMLRMGIGSGYRMIFDYDIVLILIAVSP